MKVSLLTNAKKIKWAFVVISKKWGAQMAFCCSKKTMEWSTELTRSFSHTISTICKIFFAQKLHTSFSWQLLNRRGTIGDKENEANFIEMLQATAYKSKNGLQKCDEMQIYAKKIHLPMISCKKMSKIWQKTSVMSIFLCFPNPMAAEHHFLDSSKWPNDGVFPLFRSYDYSLTSFAFRWDFLSLVFKIKHMVNDGGRNIWCSPLGILCLKTFPHFSNFVKSSTCIICMLSLRHFMP